MTRLVIQTQDFRQALAALKGHIALVVGVVVALWLSLWIGGRK